MPRPTPTRPSFKRPTLCTLGRSARPKAPVVLPVDDTNSYFNRSSAEIDADTVAVGRAVNEMTASNTEQQAYQVLKNLADKGNPLAINILTNLQQPETASGPAPSTYTGRTPIKPFLWSAAASLASGKPLYGALLDAVAGLTANQAEAKIQQSVLNAVTCALKLSALKETLNTKAACTFCAFWLPDTDDDTGQSGQCTYASKKPANADSAGRRFAMRPSPTPSIGVTSSSPRPIAWRPLPRTRSMLSHPRRQKV